MNIREYLKTNRLIGDGAMGTYYASKEETDLKEAEWGNLREPNKIEKIHREYLRAGAQLIRTNTFAANSGCLSLDWETQEKMIRSACHIAKSAVKKEGKKDIFIAGNIGPIGEHGRKEQEEILMEYFKICDVFLEEDLPVILFETFSDLTYINETAKYLKEKKDVFILADFCLNKNGYTSMGISGNRLLEKIQSIDEIDGCGFNCGIGSGHMNQILKKLTFPFDKYLAVMPNAGYPEQFQNRMVFMDNTSYFVKNMEEIASFGCNILGGCCGTTPEYIKLLTDKVSTTLQKRKIGRDVLFYHPKSNFPVKENEFYEKLKGEKKVITVELDPPFDADFEKLVEQAHVLKNAGADLITIADSPMGRSRVDSILMSVKLKNQVDISVMPHVCCRDKNMIAMRSSLLGAYVNEIRNILIVTGDPVPGTSRLSTTGVFDYNSIQLMNFVKEMNEEHFKEEPFYYGGALNYGRGQMDKVIERMKKKIDGGASYFLTQPIFSKEDVDRIYQIKEKVDTKILCGIMPFVSFRNAIFVKNEITGIYVPDEIIKRYHPKMEKEEAEAVGAVVAGEIMDMLNPIADGYYLMLPFNRVSLLEKIRTD